MPNSKVLDLGAGAGIIEQLNFKRNKTNPLKPKNRGRVVRIFWTFLEENLCNETDNSVL